MKLTFILVSLLIVSVSFALKISLKNTIAQAKEVKNEKSGITTPQFSNSGYRKMFEYRSELLVKKQEADNDKNDDCPARVLVPKFAIEWMEKERPKKSKACLSLWEKNGGLGGDKFMSDFAKHFDGMIYDIEQKAPEGEKCKESDIEKFVGSDESGESKEELNKRLKELLDIIPKLLPKTYAYCKGIKGGVKQARKAEAASSENVRNEGHHETASGSSAPNTNTHSGSQESHSASTASNTANTANTANTENAGNEHQHGNEHDASTHSEESGKPNPQEHEQEQGKEASAEHEEGKSSDSHHSHHPSNSATANEPENEHTVQSDDGTSLDTSKNNENNNGHKSAEHNTATKPAKREDQNSKTK